MKYHIEFDIDFKRNTTPGLYIALEGIDGSGKTTQVKKLAEYFQSKGREVVTTCEPRNDGIVGSIVRQVLQGKLKIPSVALQYLFSADRAIHHEEIVLPALRNGKVVITDRCFWSAIPYGIMDRIMDKGDGTYDFTIGEVILVAQGILSMYHQFTAPDYTFYLKIPLEVGLVRLSQLDKDSEIYEKKEKLEKILQGYEWLTKKFKREFAVIDANQDIGVVNQDILAKIQSL